MNKGKFIFSQVIDFLPRYEFDKIVNKYKGDYNIDENTGLRGDHTIRLTGYQPKKFYPKPFRLVKLL